ncbi:MAG: zinc metalloprotease [Nocardioidaceae bacterium]
MSRRTLFASLLGAAAMALAIPAPAQAMHLSDAGAPACFDPHSVGAGARSAATIRGNDHRDVTVRQQRAIEHRTKNILASKGYSARKPPAAGTSVPIYFHVMRDSAGSGDVTNQQITQQVAVLNNTFTGGESSAAANSGFTFSRAGIDRYSNDAWHLDHSSANYRKATRQGGANALNIWLVDFKYLGIATFPWDYAKQPRIDGIRVHFDSLPGGSIANFNLGETATHEAGHWFGLYHTFQGGCTTTNDEVADTPAQSSPTSGCPEGRDSCSLPGLDPIHNYMDYSYDSCYTQFTIDQASRMRSMFAAYRA